jgi:biopolymer transport protein ExbD/biopolymer transport protein TolR
MHGRRRRSDRMMVNAEINVVSLIDVMMLLMIVFMITAPMLQGGVDVQLARAQGQPLQAKGGVVVSVDREGTIYIDRQAVSLAEFEGSIKAIADREGRDGVFVRADGRTTMDQLAPVLAALSANGIPQAGLVFEPVARPR